MNKHSAQDAIIAVNDKHAAGDHELSEWEQTFLESLQDQLDKKSYLTEPQEEKLRDIADKCGVEISDEVTESPSDSRLPRCACNKATRKSCSFALKGPKAGTFCGKPLCPTCTISTDRGPMCATHARITGVKV